MSYPLYDNNSNDIYVPPCCSFNSDQDKQSYDMFNKEDNENDTTIRSSKTIQSKV